MVAEAGDGQHGQGVLVKQGAQDTAAGKESGEVEAGQVLVGALLAVAGHEAVHQFGVAGVERLVVQTGLFRGFCRQLVMKISASAMSFSSASRPAGVLVFRQTQVLPAFSRS